MNDRTQYIFGIHPAAEILKTGRRKIFRVLLSALHPQTHQKQAVPQGGAAKQSPQGERAGAAGRGRFAEIIDAARKLDIPVSMVDERELAALAKGGNHQGVVLEVETPRLVSLDDALEAEKDPKNAVWVGLDEITDPMNLGAILRSAACLGASTVVLPQRRTVGLTPTVQKASSGAIETLNLVSVVNLNQTVLKLKKKGFWVYGADMSGKPLPEVDFTRPVFLLIGSEGKGLHEKTRTHCDELVSIPQGGGVESLNAASACAVILYEILIKKKAG